MDAANPAVPAGLFSFAPNGAKRMRPYFHKREKMWLERKTISHLQKRQLIKVSSVLAKFALHSLMIALCFGVIRSIVAYKSGGQSASAVSKSGKSKKVKSYEIRVEIGQKRGVDSLMTALSNWGLAFVFNKSSTPRVGRHDRSGDPAIG